MLVSFIIVIRIRIDDSSPRPPIKGCNAIAPLFLSSIFCLHIPLGLFEAIAMERSVVGATKAVSCARFFI